MTSKSATTERKAEASSATSKIPLQHDAKSGAAQSAFLEDAARRLLGNGSATNSWWQYIYRLVGAEISRLSRYYDRVVQWAPEAVDTGLLLAAIDNQNKSVAQDLDQLPDMTDVDKRSIVLMNGTFNYELDIQGLLSRLRPKLSRSSRLIVITYNSYFSWLYRLANTLGLRKGDVPCTFLTERSVNNLARISGFEVVRNRPAAYSPFELFGLGNLLNQILPSIPVLKQFSLTEVVTLRPVLDEAKERPSLSIIIPARNERGNIEGALQRIPDMPGTDIEVIFVEGHSQDGTWEEILRVMPNYQHRFRISAFKQLGKGKADAVRLGFSRARKDLLTILDADLSMPPELLTRFYDAYCQGLGDFVNGSRLLYPIEGKAMKFLNKLGNIFFAKALSRILGVGFGDTLCGTKLVSRADYARFIAWRRDFGDFDPFGDFELLFPAAVLALGIVDIPIRYRDRLYGETNISRFRHGLMLLKMTLIGFFRITLGQIK